MIVEDDVKSAPLLKLPKQKRKILDDIMEGRIRTNGNDSISESTSTGLESQQSKSSRGTASELSLEQLQIGAAPAGGQDSRAGKRKRNNRERENKRRSRKRRGPLCPKNMNNVTELLFTQSDSSTPQRGKSIDRRSDESLQIHVPEDATDQITHMNDLQAENRVLQNQLSHAKTQIASTHDKFLQAQHSFGLCREKLIEVLRNKAVMDRKLREEKCARDSRAIGKIVQTQNSFGVQMYVWQNGERFKDLQLEKQRLEDKMEEVLRKKKELSQLKKKLRKQTLKPSPACPQQDSELGQSPPAKTVFVQGESHVGAQAEIYSLQATHIKRQQAEFERAEKELKFLKHQHIKFIKMMSSEKKSVYQGRLLNDRYLCTKLIGRGGFSEVWEGYDLEKHCKVACKIHALNEKWSDQKKENYSRHAKREAHIHKGLCHPRIVQLYDVFGIDVNTFCTVLELCKGMDFDVYLNMNKTLPEREARSIVIQIFEGLMYLAQQKQPIIHYDLKPGNLLYYDGEIKITDFGLSKIMHKDQVEMELTSQGCGTYWYLPPECFVTGQEPPMIGTAVDMWSGGCIFFEMLYGRRPFGHNMTQEKILQEGTLLQATQVQFPETPKVSDAAKDLIRKCLSRDHRDRPDPLTILDSHPYFSKLRLSRS